MPQNEPDLCKVFTCSFCRRPSYWVRSTPDEAMFCLGCRCHECLGLMAFQTEEQILHAYCPTCIRTEPSAAAVN